MIINKATDLIVISLNKEEADDLLDAIECSCDVVHILHPDAVELWEELEEFVYPKGEENKPVVYNHDIIYINRKGKFAVLDKGKEGWHL